MPELPKQLKAAEDLFPALFKKPFNQSLLDGSMPPEVFYGFLNLDIDLYLSRFSGVLKKAAGLAPTEATQTLLSSLVKDTIEYEKDLANQYKKQLKQYGACHNTQLLNAMNTYITHLESQTTYAEIILAISACLWLYARIGQALAQKKFAKDHPYLGWVETYQDKITQDCAEQMLILCQACFDNASGDIQLTQKLKQAFFKSLDHEAALFEAAYPKKQFVGFYLNCMIAMATAGAALLVLAVLASHAGLAILGTASLIGSAGIFFSRKVNEKAEINSSASASHALAC